LYFWTLGQKESRIYANKSGTVTDSVGNPGHQRRRRSSLWYEWFLEIIPFGYLMF